MSLEKVEECPICREKSFTPFLTCKDETASNNEFSLLLCNSCAFVITSPRPTFEAIGSFYKSNQYISHSGNTSGLIGKLYLLARSLTLTKKRRTIETFSQSGSLLDYGCGTGEFLNECKANEWTVEGIEPSEEAREKASKLTNASIHKDISQLVDHQYDIITLWHVLEHVHNLQNVIHTLTKHLKADGTIFIAVPNHESWDAKKYKEHWAAYDVPRHLWHFSKANMKALLNQHGLKIKGIMPMKLDSFYVSLLSEQYQNPDQSNLRKYIRGFVYGLISNLKGAKEDNYSSLIYIAKK